MNHGTGTPMRDEKCKNGSYKVAYAELCSPKIDRIQTYLFNSVEKLIEFGEHSSASATLWGMKKHDLGCKINGFDYII